MRLRQFAGALAGLLTLTVAGNAAAQEQAWLKDPKVGEGIGYRLGDLELHPGLAGEFGYDSNMFLRHSSENPISVWRVRVTPSLSLSTLKGERRGVEQAPRKVEFRAGVAGTYNEYIPAGDTDGENVSDFRNVGANADAALTINPQGPFGGRLFGTLIRTIQPSNLSDTSAAYNRIHIQGGTEVMWLPGGGLFDWRLGYQYDTVLFEESQFESLNNNTHTINTRGRWRFLPRTAFMFDASTAFTSYSDSGAPAYLLDSNPIQARVGLNGLMSNQLALLAMIGWGTTFTSGGGVPVENFDSVIAQTQLTFYPTPAPGLSDSMREASLTLSKISVGYIRDFHNSYFGSYYGRDRGYLSASYFFAQRVLLVGEGGITRVSFPNLYFSTGTPRAASFNDMRYDASLFAEYRLMETVGLNASFNYIMNDSVALPTNEANPNVVDNLSYDRIEAFAGLRWFM